VARALVGSGARAWQADLLAGRLAAALAEPPSGSPLEATAAAGPPDTAPAPLGTAPAGPERGPADPPGPSTARA
jgi:hypothetical protein